MVIVINGYHYPAATSWAVMNMEFPCYQCEYKAGTKGMIKIHHSSLHSQSYDCNDCEAVFKTKLGLQYHCRSKHEGVTHYIL